jgi:hypothetical protein
MRFVLLRYPYNNVYRKTYGLTRQFSEQKQHLAPAAYAQAATLKVA